MVKTKIYKWLVVIQNKIGICSMITQKSFKFYNQNVVENVSQQMLLY